MASISVVLSAVLFFALCSCHLLSKTAQMKLSELETTGNKNWIEDVSFNEKHELGVEDTDKDMKEHFGMLALFKVK